MPDDMPPPLTPPSVPERQSWMRHLALADWDHLSALVDALPERAGKPLPTWSALRPAETGMAMVRARAGGSGQRFNLGEMTITRCALRLELSSPVIGFAHIQGRNRAHAEAAALVDGLMQCPDWKPITQDTVIAPLAEALMQRRAGIVEAAGETRVDFFTMVRGE